MHKLFRLIRYDLPLHFTLLLTNWLPDNVIFLRLRGWLARPFFFQCGSNLRLGRNISFYNPSMISIGRDVYVAYGCWFMGGEKIMVGDEVIFGPYCVIVSSNHTRQYRSYRFGERKLAPIFIQSGSWIGAHAVIIAGASIGKGSAVASGAIVIDEIPDDVLAAGLPARAVKSLSDEE